MTKNSKTIVMIHGFRGTHHGLVLIARELGSNFNCLIPDLPGFAKGTVLESYHLDDYVQWLDHYLDSLELNEKPILLGHSFGSIITTAYAARFPKKIDRLVILNPIGAPALEGPRWLLTQFAVLYYEIGSLLPDKIARKWLSLRAVVDIMSFAMIKTKQKSLRRYIYHQHRKYFSRFHDAKSVLESFRTSISHSVKDFADDIHIPTLMIAGDLDDITPIDKQEALFKQFDNAKLEVIKGVGHLTHYETPDQVASMITNWLGE